jgi:hypothetical protein
LHQGQASDRTHQIWTRNLGEQGVARRHDKRLDAPGGDGIDEQKRKREVAAGNENNETSRQQSSYTMKANKQRAAVVTIRHCASDQNEQNRRKHRRTLCNSNPFCFHVQFPNHKPGKQYGLHTNGGKPGSYPSDKPLVRIGPTRVLLRRNMRGSGLW